MRSLLSFTGCMLKSCNITFETNNGFSDFVTRTCDLTTENVSETTDTYGVGAIKYQGVSWFNGSCFVGYKTNGAGIVRFTNEIGQELFTKLFISPDIFNFLNSIKITRVDFYLVAQTPSIFQNINDFTLSANSVSNMPQLNKNSPVVNTNKQK